MPLGSLIDDGFVEVVVEVAGAVGCAAEAADLDGAVKGDGAVGVGGDEVLLDAVPGALGVGFIGLRAGSPCGRPWRGRR